MRKRKNGNCWGGGGKIVGLRVGLVWHRGDLPKRIRRRREAFLENCQRFCTKLGGKPDGGSRRISSTSLANLTIGISRTSTEDHQVAFWRRNWKSPPPKSSKKTKMRRNWGNENAASQGIKIEYSFENTRNSQEEIFVLPVRNNYF